MILALEKLSVCNDQEVDWDKVVKCVDVQVDIDKAKQELEADELSGRLSLAFRRSLAVRPSLSSRHSRPSLASTLSSENSRGSFASLRSSGNSTKLYDNDKFVCLEEDDESEESIENDGNTRYRESTAVVKTSDGFVVKSVPIVEEPTGWKSPFDC